MASHEQIQEAINTLKLIKRNHRPRRGRGFHGQVAEENLARLDVLTHGHCAGCSALIIEKVDHGVSLRCKVGYSPTRLWQEKDLIGIPLGEEPKCLGYDGE